MNRAKPMYEWKDIPWHKLERNVFKLQKRIYQASRGGNVQLVQTPEATNQFLLSQSYRGA
jgi:RNA-directed DNA polymerase